MNRLSIFSDRANHPKRLGTELAAHFDVQFLGLERIADLAPEQFTVLDVSLRNSSHLPFLKDWIKRKPDGGKVIFAIDMASRIEHAQAYAFGATDVVARPLESKELMAKILGEFAALAADRTPFAGRNAPGVVAAFDSLQNIFSAVSAGESVDPALISQAGGVVVGDIEAQGLSSWVDTVRRHHSQTYQHCLIVTGVAVAFGQHIGLSKADRQRLSFAGMLHDVGKAKIPLTILEKPGPLDQKELVVMREHPQLGVDSLADNDIPKEMLDIVLHHHELLDGSGYPHGLGGSEIPDLVRIMTISDIFGALIERRSYKPPMSGEAAYKILCDMGAKLDQDLVRAFAFSGQLDRVAA
jgi:putative nucleotidyltransferase with HDIG domain